MLKIKLIDRPPIEDFVRYNAEELKADPTLQARCVKAFNTDTPIEITKEKRHGLYEIRRVVEGYDARRGAWLEITTFPA